MGQLVLIAVRNLLQHRRRTFLLGGALAAVTALLIVLTGLSLGLRQTMIRSATTLMTGHINVAGFYKVTSGQSAPVVTEFPRVLETLERDLPELDYVVTRGRGWGKLISDTAYLQVGVAGIDVNTERGFREVVQVLEGNLDALAEPNTTLLFEDQAKRLEVKVGDTVTLSTSTPRGVANTADLRVVAIARNVGLLSMFNIFMPTQSLRSLYQLNDETTGAIQIYLKDIHEIPQVAARLRKILEDAGFPLLEHNPVAFWMKFDSVNREDWTGQRLDITTWEDEISFLTWTLQALDGLTATLIGILLLIIVIGIMNTIWIAIRERTREIGTLRAIGMQRGRVMAMFLLEAGILGLASTTLGAALGSGIVFLLNQAQLEVPQAVQVFLMSETLSLSLNPGSIAGAVLGLSMVATLAALYPAWRAAKLRPITAMHHVG